MHRGSEPDSGSASAHAKLLSLGCLRTRIPQAEAISALERVAPEDAAALFRRHKVRTLAHRKLAGQPTGAAKAVRTALDGSVRYIGARIQLVPTVVAELDQAGRELGICVLGIKGLATAPYYPNPALRDIGDWDVYVASERAAWELTAWLRSRGYEYDEDELPWFKRDLEKGRLYGQIRLGKTSGGVKVFIDIHFGGYSVRHCGLIPVQLPAGDPGWQLADRSQNIVMCVANAAGDQFITAKDINDLMLALEDMTLHWSAVRTSITRAGLQGFFNGLLIRVREIGGLSQGAVRRAEEIAFGGEDEPLPPLWAPDGDQRREVTVRHAYALGRRHSVLRGIVARTTAARYYNADLTLRAANRRRAALPTARPWRCVRLVPVPLAMRLIGPGGAQPQAAISGRVPLSPDRALEQVRTPSGDLIAAAGELFLPTVYYRLSERLIRSAVEVGR
jgi:hypothetical protein